MTFYQELQLSSTGSKQPIKKKNAVTYSFTTLKYIL